MSDNYYYVFKQRVHSAPISLTAGGLVTPRPEHAR